MIGGKPISIAGKMITQLLFAMDLEPNEHYSTTEVDYLVDSVDGKLAELLLG